MELEKVEGELQEVAVELDDFMWGLQEVAGELDDNIIFASNGGDYLCYDEFSGRYFMSTIEKVQRAVNIINRRIFNETDVCLNDFYDEVGLPAISMGDMFNWDMQSGEQVAFDIRFTPGFDENRHPCLVLNYDVMPSPYYGVMIS